MTIWFSCMRKICVLEALSVCMYVLECKLKYRTVGFTELKKVWVHDIISVLKRVFCRFANSKHNYLLVFQLTSKIRTLLVKYAYVVLWGIEPKIEFRLNIVSN